MENEVVYQVYRGDDPVTCRMYEVNEALGCANSEIQCYPDRVYQVWRITTELVCEMSRKDGEHGEATEKESAKEEGQEDGETGKG